MKEMPKRIKMNSIKKILLIIIIFSGYIVSAQNSEISPYQKIYALYLRNKYDKALEELEKLNDKDAQNEKYLILKGDVLFKMKNYDKAVQSYKEAFKQKSKIAALKIAKSYALMQNAPRATEYLKIYLKNSGKLLPSEVKLMPEFKNIENTKSWINLWKNKYYNSYEIKLDEAKYNISTENYAEAFDILDKLIIKKRNRHKAYELRGDLLMLTQDYKAAAKSYKKASEIKKRNSDYKLKLAKALYTAGKYKQAEKYLNELTENKYYNPEILLLKTKNETALKDFENAGSSVSIYTALFPDDSEAQFLSGKILSEKKEYISALMHFNKAISYDNSKPEYFIAAGDAYLNTSTYSEAVNAYSMALDLNPKLPEVWYKKGIAEIKLNKYNDACEDFKKAKSMNYHKADDYIFKYCNK